MEWHEVECTDMTTFVCVCVEGGGGVFLTNSTYSSDNDINFNE